MRILGLLGIGALVGACSTGSSDFVPVAPTLIVTQGALDGVTKLTLSAFDTAGGTTCDPKRPGYVTGNQANPLATLDLSTMNCNAGVKYCGNLQIEKGKAKSATFVVNGVSGNGKQVATGCTANVALDKESQALTMKVYRFIQPATCGGKMSPYFAVQCAAPGNDTDPVCDTECLSKEEYLSSGSGGAGETSDGKNKTRPSFAWISSPDPGDGRFFAFFGDSSQSGRNQVSLRVLAPDMTPCIGGNCSPDRGIQVQKFSYFMPNSPNIGDWPGAGDAASQTNPSVATAGSKYYVAFEDGTPSKISLRSIRGDITSDQGMNGAVAISMGTGATRPSIAAGVNGSKLLVVYEQGGSVHARAVDAAMPSTVGPDQTIGAGTKPTVAGLASGFVVAWQSGADVKVRQVDATGAGGSEIKVNDATHMGSQESPAVGALPDGSVAVVWSDTGAPGIFVQRFGPGMMMIAGDQAKRINDSDAGSGGKPCASPTIAAGSGADAFFAVAWVNTANNHVYARFLDGKGGFLFNPVDGQASEFQASRADSSGRANPTVAVGGAGPYVAIGWESAEGGPSALGAPTGGTAIWGRRFPIPTK